MRITPIPGASPGTPNGIATLVSTTDATVTTIDTVAIATDEVAKITVEVSCKKDDLTEKGGFVKEAIFANNSGTITKQGSTTSKFHQAKATWNVTFLISGTDVLVQVTGAVGDNISWSCNRMSLVI